MLTFNVANRARFYQASLEENSHVCFQILQPHFLLNLYVTVFYKSLRNWLWSYASQYSSRFSFPKNSSMTKQTVRGGLGDGKAVSPRANSSSNLSNCLFGVWTYCLDVCFCPCLHLPSSCLILTASMPCFSVSVILTYLISSS
jgi:hypothetical protein